MSVEHRLSWGEQGEPRLEIEAGGIDDVYRLAHHMVRGQCEFAAIGFAVVRGIKRRLRSDGWQRMMEKFHGDRKASVYADLERPPYEECGSICAVTNEPSPARADLGCDACGGQEHDRLYRRRTRVTAGTVTVA